MNKGEFINSANMRVGIDEAIEKTGFGKFHAFLAIVCGICLFAVNLECYGISYVLPAAENDLNLDSSRKGILTSAGFLGITVSCFFWGYLADVKGRKPLMVSTFISAFVTSVISSIVPSFWAFVMLRFINGVCVSASSAITYVYFGEFQNKESKTFSEFVMSSFVAFALIALPVGGWICLQQNFTFEFFGIVLNNWRIFVLVNAVPNLLNALLFTNLPESPKFLYHKGKTEAALKVLKQVFSDNNGNRVLSKCPFEKLNEKSIDNDGGPNNTFLGQIKLLFNKPLLVYTLAACFIQAGLFSLSSGLFLWEPDIINKISAYNESLTVCKALSLPGTNSEDNVASVVSDKVFIINIIIGVVYFVGYLTYGVVVKKIGIKIFFVICMVLSSACTFSLCFATHKILIDVLLVTALSLPGICVTISCIWVADIFPTHVCGLAVSLSLTTGRLGSLISSFVAGMMLEWNCEVTFALYAFSILGCLLLAFLLPQK